VQEGEVQFYTQQDQGIFIKAGDKGVYNKQSRKFIKVQADTNVVSYATRQFVFEESSLEDVVKQLNAIYEKKIKIGENIKTCRVTVNFNNEGIETIAEILAETLNLHIAATDAEITLEGGGCE
jgi:ferric-dicitrate binding protein FerR (iron transport regulator)